MIIYNNDPDHYQLLSSSSISYIYTAYLFNYELNQNDHNQTVSCALIQQDLKQIVILNVTLTDILNIEYKAYLYGNYYFTRSFNSYSSIEINCEEFNGNPKPVYSLIWMLNGENQTLLNKTKYGRYFINNATWRHRDEEKYKRRSVSTWFARWLRSRQTTNRKDSILNRTQISRTRYIVYMIFVILFVFLTILTILYNITRGDNNEHINRNDDPQFNPFNNPFIHVGGRFLKKTVKDSNLLDDQPK
ncbi:unnamed protein product [Rotaria sp. Silwood1]|nr:unnamed protein product [Rotaria sp. Silwood1]